GMPGLDAAICRPPAPATAEDQRMQKLLENLQATAAVESCLDVEILSVATANPKHRVSQGEALERAKTIFPHLSRLEGLYSNAGIETRYSCEPYDWYQ